jgi:hypothetical protein
MPTLLQLTKLESASARSFATVHSEHARLLRQQRQLDRLLALIKQPLCLQWQQSRPKTK